MALADVEYLEYAPRQASGVLVVSNRYIVTRGTTNRGVSVFDTTTHTSRAFEAFGDTFYSAGDALFSYDGDVWFINGIATSSYRARPVFTRLDLSSGDGTQYAPTGWEYPNGWAFDLTCFVAGDLVWTVERGFDYEYMGYWDMTSMTWTRVQANAWPTLVNGKIYASGSKKVYNASTGAALSDRSANFPFNSSQAPRGFVDSSNILWYANGSDLASWDASTDSAYRSPIASGARGWPTLGPDGLVYSVNSAGVTVADRVSGAIRTESFTTSRGERLRVVVVGGKLWTPHGYPLSH